MVDIQTAWGKQDLTGLRRLVTPEMLEYFSTGLAEQTSQDIANHVEDVVLRCAEVRESWTEEATQYATVMLQWSARDYTVSLTKQRGESGYLIEGSEEKPTESSEVWTFMRYQNGKWLLSAIQQAAPYSLALCSAPSVTEADDSSTGGQQRPLLPPALHPSPA